MGNNPPKIDYVAVDELNLDLKNPRFGGRTFESEGEMIEHLLEEADLKEMLLSITHSGYLDFEPIVVKKDGLTVLEGNRRVAALKLLKDRALRQKFEYLPLLAPASPATPSQIRAVLVQNEDDARNFIGFKHVNGPQKWDAMAKAKFATDWHQRGASLDEISSSLGDTFNTVRRLVHGYRVYRQAVKQGFDPERRTTRRLSFSHLYTALARPSIHKWLKLDLRADRDPVPHDRIDRLLHLMSWLYGQGGNEPAVIRSQNLDLNRLADVMGHEGCLKILLETRDLERAWKELRPPSLQLEDALIQAVRQTEASAALAGSFDGKENVFELGKRLFTNARGIFILFRTSRDKQEGLLDDLEPDSQ